MTEKHSTVRCLLLPLLLTELLLSGLMLAVYGLLDRLTGRVWLGAALGTAAVLLNFCVMLLTLRKAEKSESPEKGQLYVRSTYILRMLVLLVVLILALKTGRFDPLATVLPLVFLRLSLFIPQLLKPKEKEETP